MAARKKRSKVVAVAQQRRALKELKALEKSVKALQLNIRKHEKNLQAMGWGGVPFRPLGPPFRDH